MVGDDKASYGVDQQCHGSDLGQSHLVTWKIGVFYNLPYLGLKWKK